MKIEFYDKNTLEVINNEDLFVMKNVVYCDNYKVCDGCEFASFDYFIEEKPDIGWSAVKG